MAKKSRRRRVNRSDDLERELEEKLPLSTEETGLQPTGENPIPAPQSYSHPERPASLSLADIRAATLRAHTDTARTIANLEAWRAEIDCTIAFLKARP
jgi:hypothetical protein